ncbi:TetR/AcrR family transcriptional regulator [Conexibacter stalactiti]|uniref:TetR/AcrR family transcriptional regulator n=1 Tax=Conexibacter stalactiti TaxID=1940611 RepID=A0ABU4HPR8_9ACTN|nr:TetR/AcrR family transcriptional regulator [Conexibacter stalactiti]MDW5594719.1 TetR/AcrR family transcriptional regulator [Conexibacter stalactiti]MEC5035361.1 TetR/AcrR family transcriptional regulator [Conexibacter stalactiti]
MTLTRRERVRQQTLAEIKQHAIEQVAGGGAAGLSLNAIARAMGMSGPAIYRYYASRDELLAELVTDAYAELTATLERVAAETARRAPARRLAVVAEAYRAWALEQPRRYGMLFGERPEQFADPQEGIAAIHGAMLVLLGLLSELAGSAGDNARATRLDTQLTRWAQRRGGEASPRVLRLGVLTWTRLHGIVSLELAGVFDAMGLDAGLLLDAELAQVVTAATA